MTTTRFAMILIASAIGMTAAAAGATTVSTTALDGHALAIPLARHGADDRGCDDHGTNACAIAGQEQTARRGADDRGCDDRGRNNCAIGGQEPMARRGADDRGCDDHGTNLCAVES